MITSLLISERPAVIPSTLHHTSVSSSIIIIIIVSSIIVIIISISSMKTVIKILMIISILDCPYAILVV